MSESKYITKPENGQFTVEQLIQWLVNTDKRYNETGAGIRLGVRIEDAVAKSEGKPCIELKAEHWQGLAEAAESPSAGYPYLVTTDASGRTEKLPGNARIWLKCIDAIKDAKDAPPAVVAVPDATPEPQAAE